MISKNNTKYTFGEWHLILHGAFSFGDSSVSNKLLTKTVPFLQASGKRGLDGGIEGNGNARIFFNFLLKPDYSGKKNCVSYLEKMLKEPSSWERSL